jgi:hypothetical protein
MKRFASLLLAIVFLLTLASPGLAAPATANPIPTFSIASVVTDTSVTITPRNFPRNDAFNVLMGKMGTRGVNGTSAGTVTTDASGKLSAVTFNIPAGLKGLRQIAIRLQSTTGSGYYAFNWFYNNTSGGGTPDGNTGYKGFPTFSIASVIADTSVTITPNNFPKNDTFNVLMGKIGTRGVNGASAGTVTSDASGKLSAVTFNIPAGLKGLGRIAIRLQSTSGSGYFAFNWFYNNSTGTGTGGAGTPGGNTGYRGFPTFSISAVVRNTTVTIAPKNFPKNDTFNVLMGKMGTRGVNGTSVGTVTTDANGALSAVTFNIPAGLQGLHQIAIRLQSTSGSGYYAFNWFYNNNAP